MKKLTAILLAAIMVVFCFAACGKKDAAKAVKIGIFTSVIMLVFTGMWLLYTPSASDFAMPAIKTIFSTTPRLVLASMLGYVISQSFDVWLYHKWWDLTSKRFGTKKFLWKRFQCSFIS